MVKDLDEILRVFYLEKDNGLAERSSEAMTKAENKAKQAIIEWALELIGEDERYGSAVLADGTPASYVDGTNQVRNQLRAELRHDFKSAIKGIDGADKDKSEAS